MAAVEPVLNTTEFGQSAPPHGPHTITTHVPGWDMALCFRDGDSESACLQSDPIAQHAT